MLLTPESSVEAQKKLGADIIIPLDELPPYHTDPATLAASLARSHRWMARRFGVGGWGVGRGWVGGGGVDLGIMWVGGWGFGVGWGGGRHQGHMHLLAAPSLSPGQLLPLAPSSCHVPLPMWPSRATPGSLNGEPCVSRPRRGCAPTLPPDHAVAAAPHRAKARAQAPRRCLCLTHTPALPPSTPAA